MPHNPHDDPMDNSAGMAGKSLPALNRKLDTSSLSSVLRLAKVVIYAIIAWSTTWTALLLRV